MENDKYAKALKEVYIVLQNSENEIKSMIPEKFKKFITDNMEKEYSPTIDFDDANWDDHIQEETQAILALIYRDYIVSEEERQKLLKEEFEEEKRIEQELREKYNTDNLFINKTAKVENSVAMVEYKESIFTKIKKWLKRTI